MRTKHVQHQLDKFPVYSAAFISPNEVALGGGGGASKTGVKNKVRIYSVSDDAKKFDLVSELQLGVGEDTPMSMAANLETKEIVCGIGSPAESIEKGVNQNCRLAQFDSTTNTIQITATRQTISSRDAEVYQRVVAFAPGCSFVVTGSTSSEVAVLSFPSLTPACEPFTISDGELYDITVSDPWFVVATTTHLHVYTWAARSSSPVVDKGTKSKKSKAKKSATSKSDAGIQLELVQKIGLPSWAGKGSTFRAARFSPANPSCLYVIVNTVTPVGRKYARKAFVCRYQLGDDSSKWQRETSKRALGDKNISCFDVSASGKLIAYGSSDCAIGVSDAQTFAPLLTILRAHEFPATTIRFNPTSTLLLSGSADDSTRIVPIPDLNGSNTGSWIIVALAILAILLAIFARVFFDSPLLPSSDRRHAYRAERYVVHRKKASKAAIQS